jgi:ribosomal protein S18 acetylase RimI-like enzyme
LAESSGASIRSARPDEVRAILALWRSAASTPSATDNADGLRTLLARDPGALLVAELDGELVGSVIVGWDGWRGSFYRLAVAPERRRAGLARKLIEAGEARLRQLGATRVHVIVAADEEPALRFWDAVGFALQPDQLRLVRPTSE